MITELGDNDIFVFGSNASGSHGAGAARSAYERFGAIWGQGNGRQGDSYGIDTMSGADEMTRQVAAFLEYAAEHSDLRFLVTAIGCGIAGFAPEEVAPLFADAPENAVLPDSFRAVLDA